MSTNSFFKHDVTTEAKPWTHENFGNFGDGEDFCFAIFADRAGCVRPEVFSKAVDLVNRMRPEFVMSVGDYIDGICNEDYSEAFLRKQWDVVNQDIKRIIPPFFYIPGNHDYECPKEYFPGVHKTTDKLWKEFFGVDRYFFIYKNVLFLCLNTNADENGLGDEQTLWAMDVLKEHTDVRWTFVFMHSPCFWHSENFAKLETVLYERNYTVFGGDYHRYCKYIRNGRKYMMLGVTGGGAPADHLPEGMKGVHFGEFDHITWVSMCGNKPDFTHLALDHMYDENVVTTEKITWLTAKYFRANKKIDPAEAVRLRARGIEIEETEF